VGESLNATSHPELRSYRVLRPMRDGVLGVGRVVGEELLEA
jgi:hypothetical protein